jgi:hypothetical protein
MVATWQAGQLLWSMLWFFLIFMMAWIVLTILVDVFRSPDLGGWGRALWTAFVILAPWLGSLVYLVARGAKMADRRRTEPVVLP